MPIQSSRDAARIEIHSHGREKIVCAQKLHILDKPMGHLDRSLALMHMSVLWWFSMTCTPCQDYEILWSFDVCWWSHTYLIQLLLWKSDLIEKHGITDLLADSLETDHFLDSCRNVFCAGKIEWIEWMRAIEKISVWHPIVCIKLAPEEWIVCDKNGSDHGKFWITRWEVGFFWELWNLHSKRLENLVAYQSQVPPYLMPYLVYVKSLLN